MKRFRVLVAAMLLTTGCSTTNLVAGKAVPQPCGTTDMPYERVEPVTRTEPQVDVPEPAGWQWNPMPGGPAFVRAVMANRGWLNLG